MTKGWRIKGFSPNSGYGWSAIFISTASIQKSASTDAIALTFTKEASDTIEVTIVSESGEEKLFSINFTGVNSSIDDSGKNNISSKSGGGCNAIGYGMLDFMLMFAIMTYISKQLWKRMD